MSEHRFMNLIMTHFRPRIGALPRFTDEELSRLTMPVLLILGARDPIVDSVKTALRMSRLLPCLTVSILPDTGHVLMGLAGDIAPFISPQSSETSCGQTASGTLFGGSAPGR